MSAETLEQQLLTRMYQGDLETAARMFAIRDYAMAAAAHAGAIQKLRQLHAASSPSQPVIETQTTLLHLHD